MAETELYNRPWLDDTGQRAEQIFACAGTHRVDSLLVALVEAIEARSEGRITPEERVLLAIEALQREVNNGGFHQFFTNSSCHFAPVLAESLREVGLDDVAQIVEQALDALGVDASSADAICAAAEALKDDDPAMAELEACDEEYYEVADIDQVLFTWVLARSERIGR